jgi:hypothetical protein
LERKLSFLAGAKRWKPKTLLVRGVKLINKEEEEGEEKHVRITKSTRTHSIKISCFFLLLL